MNLHKCSKEAQLPNLILMHLSLMIDLFLLPLDPKLLTQVLLVASYAKAMLKVLMMLNLNLPQTQGKVHYAHCFKVFCTTSQRSMQSRWIIWGQWGHLSKLTFS